MKHTYLLLYTLLFSFFLNYREAPAQALHDLDSLKRVLIHQQDTAEAKTLLRITDHYFFDAEELDSAEVYAMKALHKSDSLKHLQSLSNAWFLMGLLHRTKREYLKGIHAYEKSIQYSLELGRVSQTSVSLHNIGNIYLAMNRETEALNVLLQAKAIAEDAQDDKRLHGIYSSLGVLHGNLDQFDRAISYEKQSYAISNKLNNVRGMVFSSNNLASLYTETGMMDSSLYFSHITHDLGQRYDFRSGKLLATHQLSRSYRLIGDWTRALEFSNKYIRLANPDQDAAKLAGVYRQKALIYDTLGQRGNSWLMMDSSLVFAQQSGSPLSLASVHHDWRDLARKQGDHEEALKQARLYYQIKDSLYGKEKREEIQQLQIEFETEQQEQQLTRLEQSSDLQELRIRKRTIWLVLVSLLAMVGILGGWFLHRNRLLGQQQGAIEARQEALRAQMNPHFLFHALSAIQEVIDQEQDAPKAARYLAKFAKLMRLILENSRMPFISLEQEIRTLTLFLDLQQVRFLQRFTYDIEVAPNIDPTDWQVPPMLVQPILEELLKQLLESSGQSRQIVISFQIVQERLSMLLELSQPEVALSFAPSPTLSKEIMEERLQLLKKQFGAAPEIHLGMQRGQPASSSFSVELIFPKV